MRLRKGCISRFARSAREHAEPARRRTPSARPTRPTSEGSLALHEVDEHVVAEVLRCGEEGPPVIDLGHLLDERAQRTVGAEAERVDPDLLASAPHDLTQRGLDRLTDRRVVEERI